MEPNSSFKVYISMHYSHIRLMWNFLRVVGVRRGDQRELRPIRSHSRAYCGILQVVGQHLALVSY